MLDRSRQMDQELVCGVAKTPQKSESFELVTYANKNSKVKTLVIQATEKEASTKMAGRVTRTLQVNTDAC